MGKKKEIKNYLRNELVYYVGYKDCLIKVMHEVMQINKRKSKRKKKTTKS